MADFLSLKFKRSVLADIFHLIFNLLLAVFSLVLILAFPETPFFAMVLIFLGKWRIFAVRRRYWWPNLLASLPDIIVGFGLVVLIWRAGLLANSLGLNALPVQIILAVLHAAWLIFLKPQHKEIFIVFQAAVAQFVGIMALLSVANTLPLAITILFAFIIGYAAARHILLIHEEKQMNIIALAWGLVVSEICFAAWHWTIAYSITPLIAIPQGAIIVIMLGFAVYCFYDSFRRHKKVRSEDIILPTFFSSFVILILLILGGGIF